MEGGGDGGGECAGKRRTKIACYNSFECIEGDLDAISKRFNYANKDHIAICLCNIQKTK